MAIWKKLEIREHPETKELKEDGTEFKVEYYSVKKVLTIFRGLFVYIKEKVYFMVI